MFRILLLYLHEPALAFIPSIVHYLEDRSNEST